MAVLPVVALSEVRHVSMAVRRVRWKMSPGSSIMIQDDNPHSPMNGNDLMRKRGTWKFVIWLIMGPSRYWPDLTWSISKMEDTEIVDTADSLHSEFQSVSSRYNRDCDTMPNLLHCVLRWGDLMWSGVKIFTRCAQRMSEKVVYQVWRHYTPPFFRCLRKTGGWRISAPMPAMRGRGRYWQKCLFLKKKKQLQVVLQSVFSSCTWNNFQGRLLPFNALFLLCSECGIQLLGLDKLVISWV